MASWQSHLISLVLRARVKRPQRHATGDLDVEAARRLLGGPDWLRRHVPAGWRAREDRVGGIAGEWIEPAGAAADAAGGRTVLYLHGGGYFLCSPRSHRPLTGGVARAARARVWTPGYRLAPEHPFPAAVEDAVASCRALYAAGVAPGDLVLAGDSAGGGLALAAALVLRDAGDPLPAAIVGFSPWTDLAGTGRSLAANDARCAMFRGASIPRWARVYLGDAPADHPLASPLYAELRGLPPLLLHASASEVLLDDARRLADRARAAGVAVELALWDDVPHGWQMYWRLLPEARDSLAAMRGFLDRRLVRRPVPRRARRVRSDAGPVRAAQAAGAGARTRTTRAAAAAGGAA